MLTLADLFISPIGEPVEVEGLFMGLCVEPVIIKKFQHGTKRCHFEVTYHGVSLGAIEITRTNGSSYSYRRL